MECQEAGSNLTGRFRFRVFHGVAAKMAISRSDQGRRILSQDGSLVAVSKRAQFLTTWGWLPVGQLECLYNMAAGFPLGG